ncbi:MAG: hypothetical protein RIR91_212 [Verrucomicrobiota bacterium]|jgi:lysozyme family protein
MSPSFLRAVAAILEAEGGDTITDDPDDPGGLTRWGISQRSYPDLDIANLTKDDAVEIYYRDFWLPVRGDELPPKLALVVFDCAVNQGVQVAARLLQKACDVVQDGRIGPQTLKAARRADALARFTAARAIRYFGTRNFDKYGFGWVTRAVQKALEANA